MKKFAKLSLVAAVAVAGFTSANAGSLEEAIKNIDISGKVYVETIANDNKISGSSAEDTETTTDIDLDITLTSKVNDNVTAVVRVQADNETDEHENASGHDVTVDNIYFAYANGAFNAQVGLQDINTPNTDGEVGNGALLSYNFGPVVLAGAHFISNEINSQDVSAFALLGQAGPVNLEAWYVSAARSDNFTYVASGDISIVSLAARYATTDYDDNTEDGDTLRLDVGVDLGAFNIAATYLTTDDDGAALVTDASSANTYELSQLGGSSDTAGVDVYAIAATYTMDKMTYQVAYADLDNKAKVDEDELRFRATYKMSSNFAIMATYSIFEQETDGTTTEENDSARLEAKYSF